MFDVHRDNEKESKFTIQTSLISKNEKNTLMKWGFVYDFEAKAFYYSLLCS
jgi:hypothetical protein